MNNRTDGTAETNGTVGTDGTAETNGTVGADEPDEPNRTDRIDAVLAVLSLAGLVIAQQRLDGSISLWPLVLGGIATVSFELLARRRVSLVRTIWKRVQVELTVLLVAGAIVIAVVFDSSAVLTAGIGALLTYLVLFLVVSIWFES